MVAREAFAAQPNATPDLFGYVGDRPDCLVGQLARGLIHGVRTLGGADGSIECRPYGFQRPQHVFGREMQGRGAVDDRLDTDFGRGLDLACQVGEIGAARGLPCAIEIVIHQLATLTFADDVGKPVGRGYEARYLTAAGLQRRCGIQLDIGDGVDGIGHLGNGAHDSARDDQDHRTRDAGDDKPYENLGIGGLSFAEKRHQRRGQKRHRQHGGKRQQDGRSKPLGDRELPRARSSRTASDGRPSVGIGAAAVPEVQAKGLFTAWRGNRGFSVR